MSSVEEVLAAHLFTLYPGEIVCDCEWSDRDDKGTRAGDNRMIAAHCAHVAAALAAAGIGDTAAAEARGARAVLDAVEAVHRPRSVRIPYSDNHKVSPRQECAHCHRPWPCPTADAAREAARNTGGAK